MVTVKDVKEQNQEFDCTVVIRAEEVSFEDAFIGWSGPLNMVPEILYELPVEAIWKSLASLENGIQKFILYVPLDKLEAAYKGEAEPELPFSEEVTE